MRLPIEPVPLGRKLLQTSAEDSANDGLFYDVRQQILLAPADDSSSTGEGGDAKVLAECYVRMVFLKDGALSKPPQRIVDSIEARRSAVDTADWS